MWPDPISFGFLHTQYRLHMLGFGAGNNRSALNWPEAFSALVTEQMAPIAAMTFNFTGAGHCYAFFQPFMGFHFSHNTTPRFTLLVVFYYNWKRVKMYILMLKKSIEIYHKR
jgi:hypothetical protein